MSGPSLLRPAISVVETPSLASHLARTPRVLFAPPSLTLLMTIPQTLGLGEDATSRQSPSYTNSRTHTIGVPGARVIPRYSRTLLHTQSSKQRTALTQHATHASDLSITLAHPPPIQCALELKTSTGTGATPSPSSPTYARVPRSRNTLRMLAGIDRLSARTFSRRDAWQLTYHHPLPVCRARPRAHPLRVCVVRQPIFLYIACACKGIAALFARDTLEKGFPCLHRISFGSLRP
ncbi:hypothetical protein B0H13DRAFT_2315322 [Mycena leptocephala]|nr:hypothetical protein B0H13DRAFT_2315322 [Mycena leptocephala]